MGAPLVIKESSSFYQHGLLLLSCLNYDANKNAPSPLQTVGQTEDESLSAVFLDVSNLH